MEDGEEHRYWARGTPVREGEWAGWTHFPGGDPFEDLAGPFYCRAGPGGDLVCAFRAEPRHMNGGRFLHGGCVMTFADYCLFVIAREALGDGYAVTATFSGDFMGSAAVGDRVEGRGEVVKAGRSLVFVRGLISNAGQPMMSFQATLKKVTRAG